MAKHCDFHVRVVRARTGTEQAKDLSPDQALECRSHQDHPHALTSFLLTTLIARLHPTALSVRGK